MTIQVLKTASNRKPSEPCPWLVECPPEPIRK